MGPRGTMLADVQTPVALAGGGGSGRMDHGSTTLAEVHDLIRDAYPAAHMRVAACADADRWMLRHLTAVVGPEPPQWEERWWRYESSLFVAATISATELVAALYDPGEHDLPLGDSRIGMPAFSDHVNWRREPSLGAYDAPHLPWPSSSYEFVPRDQAQPRTQAGLLIGDDCPSFPTFEEAFATFFYGESSPLRGAPSNFAVVRIAQTGAWLRRVRITPTRMEISVGGDQAAGARIELHGTGLFLTKIVGRTRRVRLPLQQAVPTDAWLYLSRSGRWLDYRVIRPRLAAPGQAAPTDVEFVYPDDPSTELDALLASGEGPQIEFKRELPGTSPDDQRKVLKTVAAFANGAGGTIVWLSCGPATAIRPRSSNLCRFAATRRQPVRRRGL